jgi:hypothetical protein
MMTYENMLQMSEIFGPEYHWEHGTIPEASLAEFRLVGPDGRSVFYGTARILCDGKIPPSFWLEGFA